MSLQEFFDDVFKGDFTNAKKRLADWWAEDVAPELGNLVKRLTSDAGKLAEEIAREAWENWDDGDDLATVARKAFEEAVSKGLDVFEKDIADWLGIIDRDED